MFVWHILFEEKANFDFLRHVVDISSKDTVIIQRFSAIVQGINIRMLLG